MTVEEFYQSVGGDYEKAISVFKSDERINKYLQKYEKDGTYQKLVDALDNKNIEAIFNASHALKGITGTFYLTRLYESVVKLVEEVRPQTSLPNEATVEAVRTEQSAVLEGIRTIEL